jgi:hypothetical protein
MNFLCASGFRPFPRLARRTVAPGRAGVTNISTARPGSTPERGEPCPRRAHNLPTAQSSLVMSVMLFSQLQAGLDRTDAEHDRGHKLLAEVAEVFLRWAHNLGELPMINVYSAGERARCGDRDEAIPLMRAAVDHLARRGQLLGWGVAATGVLVETLLDRGTDDDVAEAEAAIERLAAAHADEGLVIREIWLLRLLALLARTHGDAATYADLRDRYRDMAKTLGFEGHIAWAEAMP